MRAMASWVMSIPIQRLPNFWAAAMVVPLGGGMLLASHPARTYNRQTARGNFRGAKSFC